MPLSIWCWERAHRRQVNDCRKREWCSLQEAMESHSQRWITMMFSLKIFWFEWREWLSSMAINGELCIPSCIEGLHKARCWIEGQPKDGAWTSSMMSFHWYWLPNLYCIHWQQIWSPMTRTPFGSKTAMSILYWITGRGEGIYVNSYWVVVPCSRVCQ